MIISTNPFPIGLAGTNRIITYCKGFLHHGYQPEVWCVRPTERYNNFFNTSCEGIYDKIKYSYPGGVTIRAASFWRRRMNDLYANYATIRRLYKSMKKEEILFLIVYGNSALIELAAIFFAKLFEISIYKEESENPEIYLRDSSKLMKPLKKWFFVDKMYSFYNGIFVMTNPLRDFFLHQGISEKKILIVPQTVELERFNTDHNKLSIPLPVNYIAYVGSINEQKDGVMTLVDSFKEVSEKFSEIHLVIAGEGSPQEKNALLLLIRQLKLGDRVHYIGRISSIEIPSFLNGAKLLVSCRPQSIQSEFGFPTKVAEYLATGKPLVTTVTGDLAIYLIDKVNSFIVKIADTKTIGSKINEVLGDYEFAVQVAQNGKELVKEKFNPDIQIKKILDYYNDQRTCIRV